MNRNELEIWKDINNTESQEREILKLQLEGVLL